jgi:hypothetical protein
MRESEYGIGELEVYANGHNRGIPRHLSENIIGEEDVDFWERVLGDGGSDRISDLDFARGFVEGALEVWDEVKDKL